LIVAAIERAHYRPGEDIAIALDPAASHSSRTESIVSPAAARATERRRDDRAIFQLGRPLSDHFAGDGLAESDWEGFRRQTASLGDRIQIVAMTYWSPIRSTSSAPSPRRAACRLISSIKSAPSPRPSRRFTCAARPLGLCHLASFGETEDSFIADSRSRWPAVNQDRFAVPLRTHREIQQAAGD